MITFERLYIRYQCPSPISGPKKMAPNLLEGLAMDRQMAAPVKDLTPPRPRISEERTL